MAKKVKKKAKWETLAYVWFEVSGEGFDRIVRTKIIVKDEDSRALAEVMIQRGFAAVFGGK